MAYYLGKYSVDLLRQFEQLFGIFLLTARSHSSTRSFSFSNIVTSARQFSSVTVTSIAPLMFQRLQTGDSGSEVRPLFYVVSIQLVNPGQYFRFCLGNQRGQL